MRTERAPPGGHDPPRRSRARMTRPRLMNILGGVMAVALAVAARPALACAPQSMFARPAFLHSASAPTLPASLVASTPRAHTAHHRHHLAHHPNLTRDLSASGPASLPGHPAGLPHSGRAATAHHAPTA